MTDQQAAELAALSAAVQADFADQKDKTALAARDQAEAEAAAAAALKAAQEAEVSRVKLAEDLRKLRAYVEEIVNPPVGAGVDWGTPEPKGK